ncbi:XrtA system polysaccharide deacetylase [Paenibacillus sp. NPDC056579]|uniref:XrtA system polysaccharide deacetylase n=1 Tax=unclassified Paenibacillus TaxID=185978 RepID=UPI001EF7760D|nr:XrtA system polysaccharide deacetylase [Paenibacillus sp. H1-7]
MFTVDVEDWFCSPDVPLSEWEGYPIRIEEPIHRILDLLSEHDSYGTFFILGWIAEKRPDLVKEIHRRGHEIASHGYSHRLVYRQTAKQFREDVRKSKAMLEQLKGSQVYGYRAPCFSITSWAFDILAEEGFIYDSSMVPNTLHTVYSRFNLSPSVHSPFTIADGLWEIPLPVYRVGRLNIPWGGGGYFRIYPYPVYQWGVQKILEQRDSFVFYIHPYDLDEDQPQMYSATLPSRFRKYYGLKQSADNLDRLLADFSCTSIQHNYSHLFEGNSQRGFQN